MDSWKEDGHDLLPRDGTGGRRLVCRPVSLHGGRAAFEAMVQGEGRRRRRHRARSRLPQPQACRMGDQRPQPRAEFRAQPADGSEFDFVTLLGRGRHGQDAADPGRRPVAGARPEPLPRDHHDPGHGAGRRGYRLSAGHRGREDDALDGRADGQPRDADPDRGRRLGPRCDRRPAALDASESIRSTSCAGAPFSTSTSSSTRRRT